ncbi:hypothetical protein ABPG75_000347 [Micractinium tetrahymenae]
MAWRLQKQPERPSGMTTAMEQLAMKGAGSQATSFATVEAARLPLAARLRLLLAFTSLVGCFTAPLSRGQAVWIVIVQVGIPLAVLAFMLANAAAYRRHAHLVAAALHVLLACSTKVIGGATLADQAPTSLHGDGPVAALQWLAVLCASAGVSSGLLCLLAFQLPPVAMAVSSLAWAAAAAAGNGTLCSSAFLAHPAAARRLEVLYRLLEPLVVPLEPLLLAAGVGQRHPARRCLCVLATLQFWTVGMLPTALVAWAGARRYTAWRTEQRRLERQRRREQAEEWGFGFKEPSSSSDCGSSDGSSEDGEHDDQDPAPPDDSDGTRPPFELSAMQVPPPLLSSLQVQARRRAALEPEHHPGDWQYAAAQRALHALRSNCGALAAAALVAAVGTDWHRRAFP